MLTVSGQDVLINAVRAMADKVVEVALPIEGDGAQAMGGSSEVEMCVLQITSTPCTIRVRFSTPPAQAH